MVSDSASIFYSTFVARTCEYCRQQHLKEALEDRCQADMNARSFMAAAAIIVTLFKIVHEIVLFVFASSLTKSSTRIVESDEYREIDGACICTSRRFIRALHSWGAAYTFVFCVRAFYSCDGSARTE